MEYGPYYMVQIKWNQKFDPKISGERTEPDFSYFWELKKELNGYFTRFDKRSAGDEFLDRDVNRVRQPDQKCFIRASRSKHLNDLDRFI